MRSFLMRRMLNRQKGFFAKLAEFNKTQYYSNVELQNYQEEHLQSLIKHAYQSVPFYKESFDGNKLKPCDIKKIDDLEKLPIIDKETIRSNYEKLLSTQINEKIYIGRTSGSTGIPLRIARNYESDIITNALYYRFLQWASYRWGDKILKFWGEPVVETFKSKIKRKINNCLYNIDFISTLKVNEQFLSELTTKILKSPPKVLRGYASSIYLLALKVLDYGFKIELDAVLPTAEKLFAFQRDKIEEAFGNNVFDQYGCGETNSIAFECGKHMGMHVASEHVILEIVDDEMRKNSRGNLIITNLDNYAMPIIRYRNADIASWTSHQCDCGRTLPLIKEIEGRVSDFIEGVNGKRVHAAFFTHIFAGLNFAERYSIKEYRIVQEKIDKLRLEFLTEDEISKKDEKVIREKINQYLGNMETEIKKVKSIPLTKMGKKIFLLSLFNRDKWEN